MDGDIPMTTASEELEKLPERWAHWLIFTGDLGRTDAEAMHQTYAMCIRQLEALLPRLRTEERDGKRKAFVAGAAWADEHEKDDALTPDEQAGIDMEEALRRYPDKEATHGKA